MSKLIIEFLPLIAFFVGYKTEGILTATLYMLIASIFSIVTSYVMTKKINGISIFSTILLLISSSMTLLSGNVIFIKMKPTILYISLGIILYYTNTINKPGIKYALGNAFTIKDLSSWKTLNLRFSVFFIVMGVINECIWRNFSEDQWVSFKVFGFLPLTILFILLQIPFILKNITSTNGELDNNNIKGQK
jgi:intracellular septation protein